MGLDRLRADQLRAPTDAVLSQLVARASSAVEGIPTEDRRGAETDLVVCPHFSIGDEVIRTIGVVAQFATPAHVTLDEIRLELLFPADAVAEAFFRRPDPTRGPRS